MHLYLPHCSKPCESQSPEWFNHAASRAVRLQDPTYHRYHPSPNQTFRNRLCANEKQHLLTMQKAEELFVPHNIVRLALSAIDSQSF